MNSARVELLRERLQTALRPTAIEIEDQSHLHAGHPGAREGKGHFRVKIISDSFADLRPLQRHKLVYDAVTDLMESDVHALSIEALTPSEDKSV
jgi:BolA protein